MKIIFLCVFILSFIYPTKIKHNCIHKHIYKKHISHKKLLHNESRQIEYPQRRSLNRPINIKMVTNFDHEYVNRLLVGVSDQLSALISITPRRIDRVYSCGLHESKSFQVENDDDDLYIYASYSGVNCESGTIAYASPCRTFSDGKPYTGMINICPSNLHLLSEEETKLAILHEFFHVLVLSPTLIDDNNRLELKYFSRGFSYVKKLISPEIYAYGSVFFGCESFDGIEIEHDTCHLQNKLFFDDLMTPYFKHSTMFTVLDLVLLQSTGWYDIDFSLASSNKAGVSMWGLGGGCSFTKKNCKRHFFDDKDMPYCFDGFGVKEMCSGTRKGWGVCQKLHKHYTKIKHKFRYFPNTPYIGGNKENDFCPIVDIDTYCINDELCVNQLCRKIKCDKNVFKYMRDGKWRKNTTLSPYCVLTNNIVSLMDNPNPEFNQYADAEIEFSIANYATNVVDFVKKWVPLIFSVNGVVFHIPFEIIGWNLLLKGIGWNLLLKGLLYEMVVKGLFFNGVTIVTRIVLNVLMWGLTLFYRPEITYIFP